MVKAHYVANAKPNALIMGSSRADVGLDASAAESIGFSKPAFNSSIPSARIREIYAYLRHAHGEGALNQAVIGLDFFMFDANAPYELGFEEGRLALNPSDSVHLERVKDYLRAFFSYDALEATIDTVAHQGKYAVSYLENGGQNPVSRQRNVSEKGGHRAAFRAALRETVTSGDAIAEIRYETSSLKRNGELAAFYEMLRFCQNEGIDLYLAISPTHALWSQAIWELGVWPDYERWKRDLTNLVDTVRLRAGGNAAIDIWDFSGFSVLNKEEPPDTSNDDVVMRWYWEASHYKHETGDLVMSRLSGSPTNSEPADFGVKLSRENIREHLESIRAGRERYVRDHPEAVTLLREALADVREQLTDA